MAENGKVIYHRVFGISNFDPTVQLKMDSQFRLGSVTKQFTAMAIMMLKERGKLEYSDDIRKYLPELPYEKITIRHLLTHTSGLPNYMTLFNRHWESPKDNSSENKIAANEDVIAMLAKHHPEVMFEPGAIFRYSNTGYVLLAAIVSRAADKAFHLFLKENIFTPLGMTRSLVYSTIRDDQMEDRVYGFRLDGSDFLPNDFHYLNGIVGAGGVYSTTHDLFKWDRALYTDKLVSSSTLVEAFKPAVPTYQGTTHYGFGWFIDSTLSGKKRLLHSGGWLGFRTLISREIEEDNTVIVLTNHTSPYIGAIMQAIKQILHDKPFTFPKISITK